MPMSALLIFDGRKKPMRARGLWTPLRRCMVDRVADGHQACARGSVRRFNR